MSETWVVNASPLIALSKIGRLDLLESPGRLTLARSTPDSRAVIDDAAARSCARTLGISAIGTLGVVLGARKAGRISSASEVLRALRAVGFRLDAAVVAHALMQVCGETWSD